MFLAPGTGFVEDSFFTDMGGGGGERKRWGAADDTLLARPPATHFLLCGLVPRRPWTGSGPRPGS